MAFFGKLHHILGNNLGFHHRLLKDCLIFEIVATTKCLSYLDILLGFAIGLQEIKSFKPNYAPELCLMVKLDGRNLSIHHESLLK